ncbi:MAG: hypothetical protein A2X70_03960 [Alphaproteobacteria bacterium GWC2_42_16]|nr:MAG: hypothetical protein A2X70_03960 [Alphaproteobacteria bacterium GWC2_42_16]OFW74801.1 MAG: hypothetical protein A2Z80_01825 [Alphaproteobacteria bacterium GWA2_41_27]OFW85154.1 MAG: hypothetical protein A3E50_06140 [Alphaproteobacteria bacterium RIFCSPHIGHO2_12_FULL_42_100]OFW85759.1 MAG: hypothetical protein A2W06_04345 [Alphaproteobacteria bacterium RBG_16_42_14]OFW91551.1 MAG: hypothetical protein A2W46_05825 [Alphaproteobacteria bacterium RIFCSPHIGHO2_12_42_13]OFW93226.1 MAG: hypot
MDKKINEISQKENGNDKTNVILDDHDMRNPLFFCLVCQKFRNKPNEKERSTGLFYYLSAYFSLVILDNFGKIGPGKLRRGKMCLRFIQKR